MLVAGGVEEMEVVAVWLGSEDRTAAVADRMAAVADRMAVVAVQMVSVVLMDLILAL